MQKFETNVQFCKCVLFAFQFIFRKTFESSYEILINPIKLKSPEKNITRILEIKKMSRTFIVHEHDPKEEISNRFIKLKL